MKRLIIAIILLLSVNLAFADNNARYFMQADSDTVSSIPYGNNEKAGNYVKSGDAKIYYEIYGYGVPVLVLHGGQVGCTYEMGRFIDELPKTSTRKVKRKDLKEWYESYDSSINLSLS